MFIPSYHIIFHKSMSRTNFNPFLISLIELVYWLWLDVSPLFTLRMIALESRLFKCVLDSIFLFVSSRGYNVLLRNAWDYMGLLGTSL